jgi:hypothetical protein
VDPFGPEDLRGAPLNGDRRVVPPPDHARMARLIASISARAAFPAPPLLRACSMMKMADYLLEMESHSEGARAPPKFRG